MTFRLPEPFSDDQRLRRNFDAIASTIGNLAAGGMDLLRVVRGTVGATGTVDQGDGFSVSRSVTGTYVVSFAAEFGARPSIALGAYTHPTHGAGCNANLSRSAPPSAAGFTVLTSDPTSAVLIDLPFEFIAIGPR